MGRLFQEMAKGAEQTIDQSGCWLTGVTGLVAENKDPEKQHRVKVIIPSIDEDMVYDEWARQMVFCLGNGYGSAFIPPKGTEVVLFGQLGQKYNLFYAPLYNEEMLMPDGYPDEMTAGVNAPGNLKLIAQLLARLAGQNVEIAAGQLTKITGQNIQSLAQQLNKTTGQTIESTASGQNTVSGDQMTIHGGTVTVNSDGSVSIHGGNISMAAAGSVIIEGRLVRKVGPPI